MWLPDAHRLGSLRFAAIVLMAGLAGGCFQPMYSERGSAGGESSMALALASVDVPEIRTPQGTRIARVSVELRNNVIFALTGGRGMTAPTHRLTITMSGAQQQLIVDINTGRADIKNYNLTATYTLSDIATGRTVVNGTTSTPVTYNIPGQQQRFVGERGLRDAENRAALVVAEQIRNRLASYFTAGT